MIYYGKTSTYRKAVQDSLPITAHGNGGYFSKIRAKQQRVMFKDLIRHVRQGV